MPQFFENAVMTNAGASLVAKAMNEDIAIDIIALVVGDGSYTNQEKLPEALKQRTTLKSQKVAYTPRSVTRDNNAIRLSALVTNVNPETHQAIVTSGFYVNEIGIIAQPSDESTDPILLSICVTAEIRGDYMPAYTGNNPVQIIQGYVTSVSNNATVSFTPPVNAFALETDLQVLSGNISELSNELLDIKMLGWSVPEDIEIRNYIGSDGKFHQRVDRIDISQLAWELSLSDANCFHVRTDSSVKYKVSNDVKIFCDRYEFIGVKNSSPFYGDDGELSCYAVASSPARELYCHDTSFDTATEFIEGNAGVYLYFELADEVVIDIDGNEAIEAIKRKLNGIPNVIDNLTSTSVTDALSAKQGKNLKDLIDDLPDVPNVVDNLTSTSSTDALSAKQGKNLKDLIDDLPDVPNVVDNLTSSSTTDALSANQGKVLNKRITGEYYTGDANNAPLGFIIHRGVNAPLYSKYPSLKYLLYTVGVTIDGTYTKKQYAFLFSGRNMFDSSMSNFIQCIFSRNADSRYADGWEGWSSGAVGDFIYNCNNAFEPGISSIYGIGNNTSNYPWDDYKTNGILITICALDRDSNDIQIQIVVAEGNTNTTGGRGRIRIASRVRYYSNGWVTTSWYNVLPDIIDNLTSTSTTDALSAKQGKTLKDLIDARVSVLSKAVSRRFTQICANGVLAEVEGFAYVANASTNEKVWYTASGNASYAFTRLNVIPIVGHKYFVNVNTNVPHGSGGYYIQYMRTGSPAIDDLGSAAFFNGGSIWTCGGTQQTSATNLVFVVSYGGSASLNISNYVQVECIDLTEAFGAGNEPTADEFKAMFTDAYYPYNIRHKTYIQSTAPSDTNGVWIQ